MIWWLLVLHLLGIGVAVLGGRRGIRTGLIAAAVAPAITTVWALTQIIDGDTEATARLMWVDALDIGFEFRIDDVALLMTLLVSGIGTLVFINATGYFSADADGGTRFPATLLAFSMSMLGLVWADSIWTLFIFWEATSVTSFLLVGHKNTYADARNSARRALVITGAGGLVLLAGLLILAEQAGTSTISEMGAVSGAAATTAAVLVMIGAATKSAQFPFHVWLPGAMAAPTPVSAYLHSATMVKAGVLLVAVLSPVFVDVGAWKWTGVAFGIASMLWGAIGALRQTDAKLILAWGTVSQLGLLITLFSLGSAKAIFAGTSLLLAHAVFKAPLFLVVGEVDVRTGTRDITKLDGLNRSMPIAFGVAVVAGLSMAGVPPLLGFPAKEAAIEAALGLSGTERAVALPTIVGGAVLTVAYTTRFLIGTFGPGLEGRTEVAPRRVSMTVATVTLGALSVLGYVFAPAATALVRAAAIESNEKAEVYELIRWPGLKTAFVISVIVVVLGAILGWFLSQRSIRVPDTVGANAADEMVDGVLSWAPRITAAIQHGSLPVYLATMGFAMVVAAIPFVFAIETDHLVAWDNPAQLALAVLTVAAALAGAFVGSRLGATLTLGAVGVCVSGLFVIHGAPDLALTQLVVETVIVVGFVVGLGALTTRFPETRDSWRTVRLVLSVLGGAGVTMALAASASDPSGTPPIEALTDGAKDIGGGKNIVNVILTDLRALDTLGEVVVLATVTAGILALARVVREEQQVSEGAVATRTGYALISTPSPTVRTAIRIASPFAIVLAAYLFFAGHNNPGGGFAAGLVLGSTVILRTVAGLPRRVKPRKAVTIGTLTVAFVALVPILFGDPFLDMWIGSIDVPMLGTIKSGSALVFDLGVTAIVVGLITASIEGLSTITDQVMADARKARDGATT